MNLSKGYYRFGTFDAKFRMSKNLGRMAIQNSIWGRCRIQKLESVGTKKKEQHATELCKMEGRTSVNCFAITNCAI